MNTLSFPEIQALIQQRLNRSGLRGYPFIHTYFVCSDKGQIGEFKGNDRRELLNKLRREKGVTVVEIEQSKTGKGREEEVDMSVFIQMLETGPLARPYYDPWRVIVLLSSDKDFVPAIRILTRMGIHTVVVGFDSEEKPYPIKLVNESYLFLEMTEILDEMEQRASKLPSDHQ